jgi:O-succinylbenzoic acid--CoA ligase
VLPFCDLTLSTGGEILVRGETLFRGYFHPGGLTKPVDGDGWFRTRDVGRIDDEGYLSVTGRADNMFISGGENIYPEEIEILLIDYPTVRQAVVVPVADERFGERPVAFLDMADWAVEPLRSWLADRLPKFKIPDAFFPWPEDVKEPGFKPSRQALKKIAGHRMSS